MAFRLASVFAVLCMAVFVSAQDEEATFRWVEVSAGVGGCIGGMMLIVGVSFLMYDFTCRDYFSGRSGEYFRADKDVADGNNTKL